MSERVFTPEERADLLRQIMAGRPEGATTEELERIYDWCVDAKLEATLLKMVQRGEIVPTWPDGSPDIIFRRAAVNA